jgi:phospholipase/carboxylesterase
MSRRDFIVTSVGVAFAPTFMSCIGSPTTSTGASPRLSARPTSPTITPTAGLSELGIGSNRDGVLYVPGGYSPATPAPLFVGLHGAGGDADNWTSYPDRAEGHGMIFLAIDSRDRTWDLMLGGLGPDVEFLDLALQHTFDRVSIDPARIALGGFSDGASYALSLGVSNGDLFSHLIAYSPGFMNPSEPIVGKPAVYVSHGSNDNILPRATTSDQIVPALLKDGYDVRYDQFAGGHEVPPAISDSALEWLLGSSVSGR